MATTHHPNVRAPVEDAAAEFRMAAHPPASGSTIGAQLGGPRQDGRVPNVEDISGSEGHQERKKASTRKTVTTGWLLNE